MNESSSYGLVTLTVLISRMVAVDGTCNGSRIPFGSRHVNSTSGGSFFQTSILKEEQANGAILLDLRMIYLQLVMYIIIQ